MVFRLTLNTSIEQKILVDLIDFLIHLTFSDSQIFVLIPDGNQKSIDKSITYELS